MESTKQGLEGKRASQRWGDDGGQMAKMNMLGGVRCKVVKSPHTWHLFLLSMNLDINLNIMVDASEKGRR